MIDEMINSTKKMNETGTVLKSTLTEMDEWDMNKLNDTGRANKKD